MGLVRNPLRVFGCIQVRLGSKRLPDKALIKIEGRSVLEWIIRRLRHCQELSGLVVSTTNQAKDDPLQDIAENLEVPCFRGSETDLIQRLLGTAYMVSADALVRITADCPIVDSQLVDQMVRIYRRRLGEIEVVTNGCPPTFPDGLDIEILPRDTLERMDREVADSLHREWFTVYLYRHPQSYRIMNIRHGEVLTDLRWTLDYPEDLELIRRIYSYFRGSEETFTMKQVLEYVREHPELMNINRHLVDRVVDGIRSQAYFQLSREAGNGGR
jgi:spore coat polysaccharide biosynthesis protein SpsF (cytidylyltransferase family)